MKMVSTAVASVSPCLLLRYTPFTSVQGLEELPGILNLHLLRHPLINRGFDKLTYRLFFGTILFIIFLFLLREESCG